MARHHQARFNLGLMLMNERGIDAPDPTGALVWLGLAARVGHEGALNARKELEARVTPEIVESARALMRER
jgi:TPR repeat protein